MNPESRMEYMSKQLRILQEREQEAKLQKEVDELLEKEDLKTFKDVPDEIKQVFAYKSEPKCISASWDPPEDNNSKITEYTLYLSNFSVRNLSTPDFKIIGKDQKHSIYTKAGTCKECEFKLINLEPNSAYYVVVTATNSNGEGYKSKQPTMVRTLKAEQTQEMYVWGSNTFSEIGLTEDLVDKNKSVFHKTQKNAYLSKPVKHIEF